jgi:hypothetical protein
MSDDSADLISVSRFNLGRLHPDFPIDLHTDRFRRKLQACLVRLESAINQLPGALAQFETMREDDELSRARTARSDLEKFVHDVQELN